DHVRTVGQVVVDLDDDSAHRRVYIRNRLHGFNDTHRLVLGHFVSHRRQLNEDDVPQLVLSEIGDTDRCDLSLDQDPLVLTGIFQVLGKFHKRSSYRSPERLLALSATYSPPPLRRLGRRANAGRTVSARLAPAQYGCEFSRSAWCQSQ